MGGHMHSRLALGAIQRRKFVRRRVAWRRFNFGHGIPLRSGGSTTLSVTGKGHARNADTTTYRINVRYATAGSTGRRNTDVKSLCWGFKLQGLTWPFVELTSHFVQIGLRVHRQVGAFGYITSAYGISANES